MSGATGSGADDLLEVDSINTYYGDSHILHDVTIRIGRNEIVTLLGRNGAGKTTLLRSIMGLTPPRTGTIRFDGEVIDGLSPHSTRQKGISWIPEDRRVFASLSVEDNLRLVKAVGATDEQIQEVYSLFPKLEERRGQLAGTLSGGEQQMLAIARSLIGPSTDLLLLDEPTEGLAPVIVDDLREIIKDISNEGYALLLVEQNSEVAIDLAERAYIIETGRIEHEDATESLRNDREILETYLGVR